MSERFRIEIELGNDAMQTEEDVARLLSETARKLRAKTIHLYHGGDYPSGALRDVNGNKVGQWEVCEEP